MHGIAVNLLALFLLMMAIVGTIICICFIFKIVMATLDKIVWDRFKSCTNSIWESIYDNKEYNDKIIFGILEQTTLLERRLLKVENFLKKNEDMTK